MAVKFDGNGGFAVNKTQKNAVYKTQILRINKNVAIFVVKKGLCYVYPSTSAMASFRLE